MHPKCMLHIYLHLPWTYFVNQKVYIFHTNMARMWVLKGTSIFVKGLFFRKLLGFCPGFDLLRESQLLSLEDVQSQRALLESQVFSQRKDLEDSLFEAGSCSYFFFIGVWRIERNVFFRTSGYYMLMIYIYMYMHNTYQICIYIYMW